MNQGPPLQMKTERPVCVLQECNQASFQVHEEGDKQRLLAV